MRIVVNAVNTASAGGWGVFRGLVPALSAVATDDEVTVLLPPGDSSLSMPEGARSVLVPQALEGVAAVGLRHLPQPRDWPRGAGGASGARGGGAARLPGGVQSAPRLRP